MKRLLIANRGEIAVRIVRACFDEGIESVLVVSDADRDSLGAKLADRVVVIGPANASESYLAPERIIAAALATQCDALHPGYGFLSERPEIVDLCEENGIVFVGPPSAVMRRSGDKLAARSVAESVGVPVGRGTAGLHSTEEAVETAAQLNDFPLLLKASAGGGGRGMTIIRSVDDVRQHFARSSAEAERAFGDGTLYLEPYIERARHVEVQIMADSQGNVIHLGERDCSTQRRYQKVIEEAPAAGLSDDLLARIRGSAVSLMQELQYVGAGTVEFLVDTDRNSFVFLEINARVQVEHPVTELVTGVDIVREQLRVARGEKLSLAQEDVVLTGHAIECRINAEDGARGFIPTPGRVTEWVIPAGAGVRVDTFMQPGAVVPPYYDSLVAKILVHADDRRSAIDLMDRVLAKTRVEGISTTIPVQRDILQAARFRDSPVTTRWLEEEFLTQATADAVA